MMPILLAWIGPIIVRILAVLGIGMVFYEGFDVVTDQVYQYVVSATGSVTGDIAAILGLMGVDTCFNIWLSAMAAKASMGIGRSFIGFVKSVNSGS